MLTVTKTPPTSPILLITKLMLISQYSGFVFKVNRSDLNVIIPVWKKHCSRLNWNLELKPILKIRVLLEVLNCMEFLSHFLNLLSNPEIELFQCGMIALQTGMKPFQIRHTVES